MEGGMAGMAGMAGMNGMDEWVKERKATICDDG